ncbi:MAG: hypothetical protein COB51_09070 [Moraxellaceae bacterium]|nr:MAG: hypothetical protein COB51_09070 [Moraxellaceae bacterium]
MREDEALKFKAIKIANVVSDNDIFVLAALDSEGGIVQFQRGMTEATNREYPPYFEVDNQVNGRYGIIKKCTLNRDLLRIELNRSQNGILFIDVELFLVDYNFHGIACDLTTIFRGFDHCLEVVSP